MKMLFINALLLLFTGVFACTNTPRGDQQKAVAIKTGTTWTPVALNQEGETVSAFITGTKGRILAATSVGIMVSDNNGTSWKPASVNPDEKAAVFSLAKDDAGIIYAGLSKYGVSVSANNGASWKLYSEGLKMGGPRSSYAMLAASGRVFKGTFESGLYVSDDKGHTWNPDNNGIPLNLLTNRMVSVTQLVKGGTNLYALTDLGVRWSSDNGKSFNKPAHNGIVRLGYMTSLATDGKNLYCGVTSGDKGVYYSTDNGENWKAGGLTGKAPYALAVIGGKLFAGADGIIYTSVDQGKTWTVVGKGLPANSTIYAIGVTPDGKLLAGLNKGGIYMLN